MAADTIAAGSLFQSIKKVRRTIKKASQICGLPLICEAFHIQKLPPMFSSVSMTTTQSGSTFSITIFIRFSGIATQPPV